MSKSTKGLKGLNLTSDRPNHTVLIQWTTPQEDPKPVVDEFVTLVRAHDDVEGAWPTVTKRWASITVVIREDVFAEPNDEQDDVRLTTTGRWASIPSEARQGRSITPSNERWETVKEFVKQVARDLFKDK